MYSCLKVIVRSVAAIWVCSFACAHGGPGKFDRAALGNLKGAGSMSVKVDRSHAFVASIALGTPPQHLKCLVDSGSADLWVPSKRCPNCGGQDHFEADSSDSFAPVLYHTPDGARPKAYRVNYGSGSVIGFGVKDTFTFGPWKVKNQSFIIVEDQHLPPSMPWDGIFGLGWTGLAKVGKPVYKRMQEAGHPAIFALVPVAKGEASLVLGVVPHAQIKPNTLVWVKSEELQIPSRQGDKGRRNFWIVSGGVAVTQTKPTSEKFLVDTGTNQMLLVPTRMFPSFIRSLLPADSFERHCGMDAGMGNLIICDCAIGQSGNLPPMRLFLGGRQFEVPIPELFTHVSANDGGKPLCLLQVQPNDMGEQDLDSVIGGMLPGLLGGNPFSPGVVAGAPAAWPPSGAGSGTSNTEGGQISTGGNSVSQGMPPFPFKIPGLAGGMPLMPEMPKDLKPGEEVEEIVQAQPDGRVCTSTVITSPDGTQRKSTKCGEASGMPPRRLQGGMVPVMEIVPAQQPRGQDAVGIMQPADMQQPGEAMPIFGPPWIPMRSSSEADPMEDLWVLGGVFMEKFVTIFDFDKKSIGFGEPLHPIARLGRADYQEKSAHETFIPGTAASADSTSAAAAGLPSSKRTTHEVEQGGWSWQGPAMIIGFGAASVLAALFFIGKPCWRKPAARSPVASDADEDHPGE